MALQTFDDYLDDVLEVASKIREAVDEATAILARHNAGGLGDVTEFTGRILTEAQYNALITSFENLTGGYWGSPGYNGTNIEAALTEKPA